MRAAKLHTLWIAAWALALCGCFDPEILPGLKCSSAGTCPPNQLCASGICHLAGSDNSHACTLLSRCCDLIAGSSEHSNCVNTASSSDSSSDTQAECVSEFCTIATSNKACLVAAGDYGCSIPMFGCNSLVNCANACADSSETCLGTCEAMVTTPNGVSEYNALVSCAFTACPDTNGGVCDTSGSQYDPSACTTCEDNAGAGACLTESTACGGDG